MRLTVSSVSHSASAAMRQPEGTTYRPHSNPAKELDGELHMDVVHEVVRIDGAMGRDRLHGGTPPETAGSLLPPPDEWGRNGLGPIIKLLVDALERDVVGPAGLADAPRAHPGDE